jgi:hypothetical protein
MREGCEHPLAFSLPDYSRPQLTRPDWKNFNGLWDYGLADRAVAAPPTAYDRGEYDVVSFDITDDLKEGEYDLLLGVRNPVLADVPEAQVPGKQRINPGGSFYTPASSLFHHGAWKSGPAVLGRGITNIRTPWTTSNL